MMAHVRLLVITGALLYAEVVFATTVSFPEFSDTTGLTLNGSAATTMTGDGTVIRIVPASTNRSGSFFSQATLLAADFSTIFQFRLSSPGGRSDGTEVGADGFVFVVQPVSSSIGALGGGLGYQGVAPSVGVEFDTYSNAQFSDPSSNHVGIDVNGSVTSVASTDVSPNFDDGELWFAWIDYDGTTLEVRANQTGVRPDVPLLAYAIDIPTIIGQENAFVGFTAGTGGAFENHDIVSWTYFDHFQPVCIGDCNGDGRVTIDELLKGVNIALGIQPVSACPSFDANRSDSVTVDELVRAVNNALEECA